MKNLNWQDLLDYRLLKDPLRDWLIAIGIVTVVVLLVALLKPILIRRLSALARRTDTKLDDAAVKAVQATRIGLLFFVALHVGAKYLTLPGKLPLWLGHAATIAMFLQLGLWGGALINFWIQHSRNRALEVDAAAATSLGALSFILRLLLWVVVTLLTLDNLGINVTALVAGLGVSGIAVALAVQNILGDLFASLSIIIDKPFVVGDFIVVDSYQGSVEHVGLKTTRLRSLTGEQIIVGNGDLLKSRVRNYKRMQERRVLFSFGVEYSTPPEQLERIPAIVRELVEALPDTRFERAHFMAFGDSAYTYEVVYWVQNREYNVYADAQQRLNLGLVRRFAAENIAFAFPTRTLQVAGPVHIETRDSSER